MRTILLVLLMTIATHVGAERLTGKLLCKVKSNIVVTISDGKPKNYSGFTDQMKVDDNLVFYYRFQPKSKSDDPSYLCTLFDDKKDFSYLLQSAVVPAYSFSTIDKGLYANTSDDIWGEDAYLNPNAIKCASGEKRLILSRYYKSDYEGVFVSYPVSQDLNTQVATLDCRTEKDSIELIFRNLIEE